MTLVLCPLAHLLDVVAERAPSHVVSLGSPGEPPPALPPGPAHLVLTMHDIDAGRVGYVEPAGEAVAALLEFGRGWDRARSMVIHCQLGISRSTAAAFALACQAAPEAAEAAIARALRRAVPCATPNPLLVELADGLLGRDGRMVAAVRAIGRGRDYAPYRSADLSTDVRADIRP